MHANLASSRGIDADRTRKPAWKTALMQNAILLVLVLCYLGLALWISSLTFIPFHIGSLSDLMWMTLALVPTFLLTMVIWRFAHMAASVRPEKPTQWLVKDLRTLLVHDHPRLFSGCLAVMCIVFFSAIFGFVKETIPVLNPFAWDQAFAQLDRSLHGGVDPFVSLRPLIENSVVMQAADLSYSVWFLLIYFFVFLACMDQENLRRRNTFLFAFILSWIIGGSVLAVLFSSVGPIYYQAFGFGDQFALLETLLSDVNAQTPLLAVELQNMLLNGYKTGDGMSGISAMPSMHLATAWLMAFQAFQYSRVFGWIMIIFAVIIQVSSVILGWHYAIDGYAGLMVAGFCWVFGKRLADIQDWIDEARSQTQRHAR